MNYYHIEIDGEELKVAAIKKNNDLWFHYEGRTRVIQIEDSKQKRKKHSSDIESDKIFSSMPGKILKLLKNKGESVEKGQVVIVMEAMKMEYSLEAQVSGVIEEVHCKEGEQVTADKLLLKIQAEKNEKD